MGGPDATPDLWNQPFSAVRASGGYPGNEKYEQDIVTKFMYIFDDILDKVFILKFKNRMFTSFTQFGYC